MAIGFQRKPTKGSYVLDTGRCLTYWRCGVRPDHNVKWHRFGGERSQFYSATVDKT